MTDQSTTMLLLTGDESLLIRKALCSGGMSNVSEYVEALLAYNRGVIRGTERIKAEFEAAQKVARDAKNCTKPPSRG